VTEATVVVEVPATSANLGPGFDSLGLALELVDRIEARFTDGDGVLVDASGEGAASVPSDATNLVARVVRTGLATFDESGALAHRGLALRCTNAIPHGRGLGSSAAAIVGGLLAAAHLAGVADELSPPELVALASRLEGHPDNVAASVLGGATIAWMSDGDLGPVGRATRFEVLDSLTPVLAVPAVEASTTRARGALPASVAHADAAFNAARCALLVRALSAEPGLLLEATDDRLHQRQRRAVYPASLALVEALRARAVAAAISGAGPSVIAFAVADPQPTRDLVADLAGSAWQVRAIPVARTGARAVAAGAPAA
jgi:homoserine kinase